MKPLISICMPNYNYGNYISEAIESVLAQSYDNFELIIGDNASTDNSVNIIKSYNDPRIKLIQNKVNISLYQNINNLKNLAKGELIAILHSDDKYKNYFLEEIVSLYKKYPGEKVFITGVNIWHSNEERITPLYPYKSAGIKSQYEVLIRLADENNIGNGVNVVCHRDCFDNSEIFISKYKYAADYDLWTRLAEKYNFVYTDKILAYYRIHGTNLSHTVNKNLDMFKEGLTIYEENYKKSKVISAGTLTKLNSILSTNTIKKAFYMGIKYKSGGITQNMLKYIMDRNYVRKLDLNWHIIYWLSSFINEKTPDYIVKLISLFGRSMLVIGKYHIGAYMDNLIKVSPVHEIEYI